MPAPPNALHVPGKLLEAAGRALHGEHWQSELARSLKIDLRQVQRWAQAARADTTYQVSSTLLEAVMGLLERKNRGLQVAYDNLRQFYDERA